MNQHDLQVRSILVLLKFDCENLYTRLTKRFRDYMQIYAMKRTRDHFPAVFSSRYDGVDICDLKYLSEDLLISLNIFYKKIEEMRWYLQSTEDMPATVEDKLKRSLKELKPSYDTLVLYLEGELGHVATVESEADPQENNWILEQSVEQGEELADLPNPMIFDDDISDNDFSDILVNKKN